MKQLSLVLLGMICGMLLHAQTKPADCTSFKTGTFTYVNDSSETILIKRTANRQEEVDETKNIITKFKIKWIDDCSYELKQVWSNSKKQRKQNKTVTTVVITGAGKDQYEYTCGCKDEAQREKSKGIAYRVSPQ